MNGSDTITIHHLVTTTIAITANPDPTAPAAFLTLGDAHHTVRRLTDDEIKRLYLLGVVTIVGVGPDPEIMIPLDPATAAPVVSDPKPTPDPAPAPAPKAKRTPPRGGRKTAAETQRINDAIRTALATGASITEAAEAAGVSSSAAQQRISRYKLRDGLNPSKHAPAKTKKVTKLPNPKAVPAPQRPASFAPKPTEAPTSRMVSALGAKRRILSLYRIGYDHLRLNQRLGAAGIVVSSILADDVTEIPRATHAAIDDLWHRLRYTPVTPSPASHAPRAFPPPGAWDNIDDPNEHHEI
ncbi:hypothetical protein [Demequina gelatinilytica]|uniref:hypothetical protein n=1 Tax=Demequina gelatinilytica TaxID=1638980 RepID=UPI000785F32F|nr:hypothetical protein [Demequina gelatinilytica]